MKFQLVSIIIALTATVFYTYQAQLAGLLRSSIDKLKPTNTINTNSTTSSSSFKVYTANRTMTARAVAKVFLAVEKAEGAGARVRRSIGVPQLRNFSPFLMLDHFSVADGAGFPDRMLPFNSLLAQIAYTNTFYDRPPLRPRDHHIHAHGLHPARRFHRRFRHNQRR